MQIKTKYKVIFMGTPSIAKSCLKALLDNNTIEVVGVVTQPDKLVGRKKILTFSPVKQLAIENNLKIYQPHKLFELKDEISLLKPDLIYTCAFGQFIPESILNIPRFKCVNLHASLLPQLRGGAPIHYAIINRLKKTGLTLMYMIKQMDAGNIIKQFKISIDSNETYKSLYEKLSALAYDVTLNHMGLLFNDYLNTIKQDESLVTFGYNITRQQEKINWNDTALNIDAKIRGLYDKPIAYTIHGDQEIKVHKASIIEKTNLSYKPGEIVQISKDGILVSTKQDLILLEIIQLPSKTPLDVKLIINGSHKFKINSFFN